MKQKEFDYLIVGAGLYGATFAHLATKAGKHCLVIDKRPHLGGNLYCENICGINVHKYGAHIFHTSDERVWKFVNSLVPFNRYTNSPIAMYEGKAFNLPFNMNTFHQMWGVATPDEAKKIIEQQKREVICRLQNEGVEEPRNLEEQALCLVGKDIYEKLIKGYTEKQWGRACSELPSFIIKRLPVRFVYDNNYFNDKWQGIPEGGYNRLFDKLLENVPCETNVDFFEHRQSLVARADKIVYTGKLDQFYDYRFGHLQYRTVEFEHERLEVSNYQGCAVVNYTEKRVPWTRIIEHKHFEHFGDDIYRNPVTVISKEYSSEWSEGSEPFYPINDVANSAMADRYRALAAQEQNVIFGGRLAEYRYYDMAPIIANVMNHPEIKSCIPE